MKWIRKHFLSPLKRWYKQLPGLRIEILLPRPQYFQKRYDYQKRYIDFNIQPGNSVLDIGSGNDPFPYATILTDRYLQRTHHRKTEFQTEGKPVVISSIEHLPFADSQFEFVYCAHLLEHVDDPIAACREIMRVGQRGYIETPTLAKDMLYAWAKGMHRWYLVSIGQNLCFYEYSDRQLEGVGVHNWHKIVRGKWYHPLQLALYNNLDLFNVMFCWDSVFHVYVFYLNGDVKTYLPNTD